MVSDKQSTQNNKREQKQMNRKLLGAARDNSNMESETDGVATPLTLDVSHESSDLSDSALDFEVERNWSMIFTDDNYSTDHDIRSNFSSSEEGSEIGGSHNVVSETESETAAFATTASSSSSIPHNKQTATSTTSKSLPEEGTNSVSTLKATETSTEGSFSFPDPIKNVEVSKRVIIPLGDDKHTTEPNSLNGFLGFNGYQSPQAHVMYGLMLLLSIDILVQMLNGYSLLTSLGGSLYSESPEGESGSMNTPTIIRYATKTETHYLPGETITVETAIPYETVISKNDYDEHHDEKVGSDSIGLKVEKSRTSSKVLVADLLWNLKDDTISGYKLMSEYSFEMFQLASKTAHQVYQESKRVKYTAVSQNSSYVEYVKSYFSSVDPKDYKLDVEQFYKKVQSALKNANEALHNSSEDAGNFIRSIYGNNGYFDFLKEPKRNEAVKYIGTKLSIAQKVATLSSFSAFNYLSNLYNDSVKTNGPIDRIKGGTASKLKSLKEGSLIFKHSSFKILNDEWSTLVNTWKNKGCDLVGNTKDKLFGEERLKRASFGSKKTWSKLKSKSKFTRAKFGEMFKNALTSSSKKEGGFGSFFSNNKKKSYGSATKKYFQKYMKK